MAGMHHLRNPRIAHVHGHRLLIVLRLLIAGSDCGARSTIGLREIGAHASTETRDPAAPTTIVALGHRHLALLRVLALWRLRLAHGALEEAGAAVARMHIVVLARGVVATHGAGDAVMDTGICGVDNLLVSAAW